MKRVACVLLLAGLAAACSNGGGHRAAPTPGSPAASTTASGPPAANSAAAPAALVAQLASTPVRALHLIGAGTASPLPTVALGPLLTKDGKPRIVWIGAEYCPYCAAERWPLILALTRFGQFSNLRNTASAATSPAGGRVSFPNTQTLSFHGSSFVSDDISFDAVEQQDRAYQPLDTPTRDQSALFEKYDAPPNMSDTGSIPFIDFGDTYLVSGATYSPAVLRGKSAVDIASALSDPRTDIAKGVDGTANLFMGAICALTENRPVTVCSDPAITAARRQLGRGRHRG